ncbi:MAG: phosphoribosylanthranilate isomerase [Myxococcaceae bacterium]
MTVQVKICGVRKFEDVAACVSAGADAVGFNFYLGSPRYLSPEHAAPLVAGLPAEVTPIGVFVDATPDEVAAAVRASGVKVAQLHGGQSLKEFVGAAPALIHVVRVRNVASLPEHLDPHAQWTLLDTWTDEFGGSGHRFAWNIWEEAKRRYPSPIWMAGGLTPENVEDLVRRGTPDGVDVASGVEHHIGQKDPEKIRAFIHAVRRAQRSLQ